MNDGRRLALESVKKRGIELLLSLARPFRRDQLFLCDALKENLGVFFYIDTDLKNDPNFLLAAIEANRQVIDKIPYDMYENREFLLALFAWKGFTLNDAKSVFNYIERNLRKDKSFLLAAMNANKEIVKAAIWYIPDDLYKDREFVLALVAHDGLALQNATKELQKDIEIVLTACANNIEALKYSQYPFSEYALVLIRNFQPNWTAQAEAEWEAVRIKANPNLAVYHKYFKPYFPERLSEMLHALKLFNFEDAAFKELQWRLQRCYNWVMAKIGDPSCFDELNSHIKNMQPQLLPELLRKFK